MRLDKFIANNANLSRSDVRRLLKAQRITINGETAKSPALHIGVSDKVSLDGKQIVALEPLYLMLNKPIGVVCANQDGEHPTVLDLIANSRNAIGDIEFRPDLESLQIAGRLDLDTTGLVLLTHDGQWNHRITSPSAAAKKTYQVTLEKPVSSDLIQIFHEGLLLKGEKRKTRPAELVILDENNVRLSLREGKYHQVKRMFAAIGNHVLALHRESVAGISLTKDLPSGKFRKITKEELTTAEQHLDTRSGGNL